MIQMRLRQSQENTQRCQIATCDKCGSSNMSEYLHCYYKVKRFMKSFYHYVNTELSELDNKYLKLYCDTCFSEVLETQAFFQRSILLNSKLTQQKEELNAKLSVNNARIINMNSQIKTQNIKIEQYQRLLEDQHCEQLVEGINLKEITQILICVRELYQDIKDIYADQISFKLQQFESIESASHEINKDLRQMFHEKVQSMLIEAEVQIVYDIEECKKNEEKLRVFQEEVPLQFNDIFNDKILENKDFNNFIEIQQSKRQIQAKESVLEKINLIREMAFVQFAE